MTFFSDYSLFLAKTATIITAILIIIVVVAALKQKTKAQEKGVLSIKKINEKFDEMKDIVNEIIQTKSEKKSLKKQLKKQLKKNKPKQENQKPKLFVLEFCGDIKASALDSLREEITAILLTAKACDQVLLCLESGGGMVNAYGLAASQLQRLRNAKIHLTIAIDKIAASGGYMMACVANKIIAAPFSIIGSIGVIAQLPNFHRFLDKKNIDFEQITAGEYKRTLTVFGKNTEEGRIKMQREINEIHSLFKTFIKTHREQIVLEEVATGEHWLAAQALEKQLVDTLQTSDDFLLSQKDQFDIYQVRYKMKERFAKRLLNEFQSTIKQDFHLS